MGIEWESVDAMNISIHSGGQSCAGVKGHQASTVFTISSRVGTTRRVPRWRAAVNVGYWAF